jgi:hypothetical protein
VSQHNLHHHADPSGAILHRAMDATKRTQIPRELAPRENVPFVLKHFTKAGGTFTKTLLAKLLPKNNFRYISDDASLAPAHADHALGMWRCVTMRNVCDLYVSCVRVQFS